MPRERMSQYMRQEEFGEAASGRVRAAYDGAHEIVGENPAYSALACFGLGVGVGAVLTILLRSAKKEPKSWYEGYLPDQDFVRDLSQQVRETVGRYLKRR
ncbi:MAG TPA: hypothetical protein PK867_25865 [Pirellulales bacterium]|nr:hypothetical protein [Pirellulales bacterium]